MRNLERIKPFMEWLTNEWLESPDQRFGQLLINKGIVEDSLFTWTKEIQDYRLSHKDMREIRGWNTWDKKLKIYKRKLIKELSDTHIKNIFKTEKHIKGTNIEQILKEELKYRKKNKIKVK